MAQQRFDVPDAGTRLTLQSGVLGEERVLWVWTPPQYSDTRPGLPVLYVLDPDVHFRHATALADFLAFYLRAPEMIVVGVLSPNRDRDLTPPRPSAAAPSTGSGGGDRFVQFLTDEVRPLIQRRYNVAPFSILAGHSLGGLLTVHAAISRPAAFSAYVAMSPSLDFADSVTLKAATDAIERKAELPRFLFLALAAVERPGISSSTQALTAALRAANPSGLRWESAEIAGENHLTAPLPGLHQAMRWLFTGWVLPIDSVGARMVEERSLAAFDQHFEALSRRFGYEVRPAELAYSIVGDRLYRAKAFTEAIALFGKWVALYPRSPLAHDELARTYEAAGRRADAIQSYQMAIALAESQRHPELAAIRKRLERVRATAGPK